MARGRRPVTSATPAGRSARARAERVESLLAGETLDTVGLSYDLDAHHVAVVAEGDDALSVVSELAGSVSAPALVVDGPGGTAWGWVGGDGDLGAGVAALVTAGREILRRGGAEARVAIGEPAQGLGGWRLTHRQARAALPVAMRGEERVVRYGEVAVLASALRDDLLAASLRRLYLEPLEDGRGPGGEELRRTLLAYFAAGRSATAAGKAIGVTRQAVARRLRTVEEILGRPLTACAAELEIALRFEALDATPLSAL